jgi:Mn2+/Fe2+ NRAMP family transporter
VLAGSAAYAVGETLSWPVGLAKAPHRAKAFYAAIAVATAIGCALNFTPINPIRALYWSAVLNGVVAVPVMVAMMLLSTRTTVMGSLTLPRRLHLLGWLATAAMASPGVASESAYTLTGSCQAAGAKGPLLGFRSWNRPRSRCGATLCLLFL